MIGQAQGCVQILAMTLREAADRSRGTTACLGLRLAAVGFKVFLPENLLLLLLNADGSHFFGTRFLSCFLPSVHIIIALLCW